MTGDQLMSFPATLPLYVLNSFQSCGLWNPSITNLLTIKSDVISIFQGSFKNLYKEYGDASLPYSN